MTHSAWRRFGVVSMALVAVLAPSAAHADRGVASVKVGSSKTVGVTAILRDAVTKDTTAVRVIGTFSKHASSSVHLKTLRICLTDSSGGGYVLPTVTKNGSKVWTAPRSVHLKSGDCTTTYTLNRTFKAASGKELFAVRTNLGFINSYTINGFNR